MLVPELFKNRDASLPKKFYDSIPQYCIEESCGFPLEMSESLTQLHCSNPKCPSKVVQRLIAMANKLGVKDLGESRATKFINTFGIKNPLLIFGYEPAIDGAMGDGISVETSQKIVDQFVKKNSFTLSEYVSIANLPFIQTSALTKFGDYDSLEEAYKDIEMGGVEFIRNKLNIKKGGDDLEDSVSVRALKVYDSLMTFKDDLFEALEFVTIISVHNENSIRLKAVCSDEVGMPFKTKADFYATINNRYENIHVDFLSAVTKDIDYLIWAGANGRPARYTNKVKKVEGYNAKYEANKEKGKLKDGEHYIPIMTALDFLNMLDKMAGIEVE